MQTEQESIAQMSNGELFRASAEAAFTGIGEVIEQMVSLTEPYLPVAALGSVWAQLLAALGCSFLALSLAKWQAGSPEDVSVAEEGAGADGAGMVSSAGPRAATLGFRLVGTLAQFYLMANAVAGIYSVFAWLLVAIGSY